MMIYAGRSLLTCFYLIVFWASASQVISSRSARTIADLERGPPKGNYGVGHHGFPAEVKLYEEEILEDKNSAWKRLLGRNKVGRWMGFAPVIRVKEVETRHVVDLLGGIAKVGEYYTRVEIGGQQVRLQIDTGSSTMALPMAECDRCLPGDQRYDIKLSKSGVARWISCADERCERNACRAHKCKRCSAHDACCADENPSACGFSLRYGDGSGARGALMVDTMTWGRNGNGSKAVSAPIVFGGILHDSKDFQRSSVDGILGMAYETLACNPSCVEPPFQQMVKAKKVRDRFEVCVSSEGGKLILGERDPSMTTSEMKFVPLALSDPPTYYSVNISSTMYINERSINLPNFQHAIIDSGTTLIVVSKTVFLEILNHLMNHFCHIPDLCRGSKTWFKPASCVHISDDILKQLPVFKFVVGEGRDKMDLEVRPEDYMIKYHKSEKDYRCVGFMAMDKLGKGTDIIMGNTLMQRYVTFYDRENNRMGFAISKGDCGGRSGMCASYTQCQECASDNQCSYDFQTELCGTKHSGITLLPYPTCSGKSCLCKLGGFVGPFFGVICGLITAVVIGILLITCSLFYRRKEKIRGDAYNRQDDSMIQEELLRTPNGVTEDS